MALTLRTPRPAIASGPIARWADLLAPLLIVAVALPPRLANIGSYSGKADEGTRAEQLLLMAAGYRPVRDVFASQGPLSLDVFYPFFALGGETLAGARLAVVVYSVLALLAVWWIGRFVGGPVGGWAAALLLLASPTYLENSKLALVEVPAVLPAAVALAMALAYQRDGRRSWLVASAVALALAVAIKPMIVAVVPAVALALLLRERTDLPPGTDLSPLAPLPFRGGGLGGRGLDLLLFAAVAAGLLVLIVLLVGPSELYDQMVRYRLGSRQAEGWSLAENWTILWGELRSEGWAFSGLAAVSAVLLLLVSPRTGLPLATWVAATWGLLLVYSPLADKHAAIVPPPTAALAGAGLGLAWRLLSGGAGRGAPSEQSATLAFRIGPLVPRLAAGACAALLLAHLWAAPAVLARTVRAAGVGDVGEAPYREESALVQALTTPAEYILVDDAYLAFLNRRLVPPKLVDTSIYRIRSGALSGSDVVAQAEAFDVRLLMLVSDNLRDLRRFREWADERFVVARIAERPNRKDRALYLRHDVPLADARSAIRQLTPDMQPIGAELEGQVRLAGFALDRQDVRAGGSLGLTVEWEALAPSTVDWRPVTYLRDRDGKVVDQTERSLGGGSGGTTTWEPGRWVFRGSTLTVPPRTPPGDYTLGLGLYDSRARRMAAVTSGPDAGGEEVRLGTVRVR